MCLRAHISNPLPRSNPYHFPVTFNSLPDVSHTVVSQKSAHLQKSAHRYFVLYGVKVYLIECPLWSMVHMADQAYSWAWKLKSRTSIYIRKLYFTEGRLCIDVEEYSRLMGLFLLSTPSLWWCGVIQSVVCCQNLSFQGWWLCRALLIVWQICVVVHMHVCFFMIICGNT